MATKKSSNLDTNFKIVKIGKQEWMVENLNVDRFRNGDLIPEIKSPNEWEKAGKSGKPAWCYFDNELQKGVKTGKGCFFLMYSKGFCTLQCQCVL